MDDQKAKPAANAVADIETIVRLEQEALESRTFSDRISEKIAAFAGSMPFVTVHVVAFIIWAFLNLGLVPWIEPFDPYPFNFMTMIVSMEGVLIATFILIRQNRMSRRADRRDLLNLQIDLMAEKEVTKILQLQQRICERLEIPEIRDPEIQALAQTTAVGELADELNRKIPE
jgi:uncharacterized membrane protein